SPDHKTYPGLPSHTAGTSYDPAGLLTSLLQSTLSPGWTNKMEYPPRQQHWHQRSHLRSASCEKTRWAQYQKAEHSGHLKPRLRYQSRKCHAEYLDEIQYLQKPDEPEQ